MGGKASGGLALVMALLGLLLIVSAIRGTYVPVWRAISGASPAASAQNASAIGSQIGSNIGKGLFPGSSSTTPNTTSSQGQTF